MSEAQSALAGASFSGLAEVREAGLRGMITLRGDLASDAVAKALKAATGLDVPGQRGAAFAGDKGVLWMSPDELLVLTAHAEAPGVAAALSEALAGAHHLVAEVSDARAVFTVSGEAARDVLGKLTPADLHPGAFGPGQVRRTRIAQVPAALWMRDVTTVELVCFRSVARYVFDLLSGAAGAKAGVDYY